MPSPGSKFFILINILLALMLNVNVVKNETLSPPYFNLAEGKNITASATCGVGIEGPELYCKLIGANADNDITANVIQGQYCDECDPTRPEKSHPPEHAVDGIETWWQSPPLSRGMKYNEVNLTIDLGQEFHVAYVFIKMANSPRPGLWVLEKSADYGKTYTPWQYFSDSPADCERFFGKESLQPITRDDSVICTTEYSKIVPLEGGEIPISLLNKRPSANHYFNSTVLQEWTRATNVRLRFLRTKNLLGHLMSVARQDPSVTRRYFYSIKDISIGGRCMCNGHADACDIPDLRNNRVLLCRCKHNTCGAKCDVCCPGYEQKAWRQSKHNAPFICEPCNCFQHSNECIYDKKVDEDRLSLDIHGRYSGGGVCQNCQHNTEGINCNKCKPRYFKPYTKHWNETDVCQPCQCDNFYSTGNCAEGSGRCECRKEFTPPNCDSCSFGYYDYPDCKPCECYVNGTANLQCSSYDGQCPCLPNFGGQYCTECAPGYYKFPECVRCECDALGSISEVCDQNGNCTCKNKYDGAKCDRCRNGYYYAEKDCVYCNCDISGTEEEICDKKSGRCKCKQGYGGERCDTCISGYYGHPDCKPCECSKIGSHGTTCTTAGKCSCLANYAGRTCSQCSPGYYSYPNCTACECDPHGSNGISCDQSGTCECHNNFAGQHCDKCKEGYYNFPACEECNCHPAGVIEGFPGCGSVPPGELCKCKERVEGRICDKCRPLYWNLNINNPNGCEECNCTQAGVLGGIAVCDNDNGQCICKPSVVARSCSECAEGTYGLSDANLFGCKDCNCDVGGSVSNVCHKYKGQCYCQSRVIGRRCDEPLQAHYFPTLYQYKYEIEDGRTPENNRVRYSYDERIFPDYSWKGYAVFSLVQREVIHDVIIQKSSLYRMVLRFVNPNKHTVIGGIRVIPEYPNEIEQYIKVQFRNTSEPSFVTVSGESGNTPRPFVLNPGRWSVAINVNESIYLDYFVLQPEDFYLATVLNQKVIEPCTINNTDLCRHYAYPNITEFDKTLGAGGFIKREERLEPVNNWYQNRYHLQQVNALNKVPLLNELQPEIAVNVSLKKPGSYVFLVNYVTPLDDSRTENAVVRVTTRDWDERSAIKFYSCPYTTICRQVVTNLQEGVGVYNIDSNYAVLNIAVQKANVGIHSVYAIPYERWSLDYIKPRSVCIYKNGTCIASSFRKPPETKKIHFEQESEGETAKNKLFSESSGTWLNSDESGVDLNGKVATPGYYTFILHYYQPHLPEFNLDVIIQNGQFYEAKVPVKHCPSKSGCRSVITQTDRNNKFSLTENFMITFKAPEDKNVFLGYLLVVPADLYNERNLVEEDLDRTGEFISQCGNNHFYINTNQTGFCRDAVFSITTAHNTGALPCQCDFAGSLSFECEKFGGQCRCKDHIIGRKCEACKTGYYGFPQCKPCNCPSTAYCEPNTGQCICPPHVTGERCDQCEPYTYGYDPLIGCEECNCNTLGVNDTLQCNLLTGECPCKENIVGRPCDQCKPGHYFYPVCQSCECDTKGTTDDICDQVSAECFCKKHVVGLRCDYCREGSFNLQQDNEEGCTECFCFGKTTRCVSSQYVKVSVLTMKEWDLVDVALLNVLNVTKVNVTVETIDGYDEYSDELVVSLTNLNLFASSLYFSAPQDYLGQKLTSYGGFLNYTIYINIGDNGTAINRPDVILQGHDTYLTFTNFEQPAPSREFLTMVKLVESNFELPGGIPAKREHIMDVLKDLRGVYIRATYWSATENIKLMNVFEDMALESDHINDDSPVAVSVEQCLCPPNYQGLSCEECSPGYYRIQSRPHGGFCVPCECHGHATECDVNTGVCLNCSHNTRGDHCELCEVGYHGNAKAGTPMDCLICACPLPIASNNFATACDVSADGEKISCECRHGYIGARCQSCSPGYYGIPEKAGNYCKPCECSGNINPEDPTSCDTVTGACLRCLNNTFGEACALCAPGYFGDAINLKDCQACICDELGTERCDSYTGKCVCKPNVIGEKCDRCEIKHFGFESGRGCSPCECAEASDSDQCEGTTGQCKCKPGVASRTCNRCAAGYWNYTSEGCVSCGCKSEYSLGFGCNVLTGQCECLQGVQGEKCDRCPHRWAFVPEFGCHQCDSCHHALLDDTDGLALMLDEVIAEFDSTQSGFFTRRRLQNMNEQLEKLLPLFYEVDPKKISLNEVIQELERLEQDSKNLNRKSNYSLENSDLLQNQSTKLKDKLEILLDEIFNTDEDSLRIIEDIEKITGELHQEAANEIDKALEEGQALLDGIKIYNLTGKEEDAKKQLQKVEEVLKNVTEYKVPVDNLHEQVDKIKDDLKMFNENLDDLHNHTQHSLNVASQAEDIIKKSGKDRLKTKLENIENQLSQAKTNLNESERLLFNATDLLDSSYGKLKDLKDAPEIIETANIDFEEKLEKNKIEVDEVKKLQPKVEEHASNLSDSVQQLEHILSESQLDSKDAVKAARAYKDIVEAVKSARKAAEGAQNDTVHASSILNKVQDETNEAEVKSADSLDTAYKWSQLTRDSLQLNLTEAVKKFEPVKEVHDKNEGVLKDLEKILENIQVKNLEQIYMDANENAKIANRSINDVEEVIQSATFVELPKEATEARSLSKELDDAKRSLVQTEKQINVTNMILPEVEEAVKELPERQMMQDKISDEIKANVEKLNQQIALARDIANRIKVGVAFSPSTYLELRNPKNLEDLAITTKFSGYFKTNSSNGFLFYIGNPNGTNLPKTKTDDYMALVIENSYPTLIIDVGNGFEKIVANSPIENDKWYQYEVNRVGNAVTLTIRTEDENGKIVGVEKTQQLSGPFTIFNLDKEKSKVFVGGFPSKYEMPDSMHDINSFQGEMEDVVIGNTPISLWNFKDGYDNRNGTKERDKLVVLAPSTGYRFNGNGFVVLDSRSLQLRGKTTIELKFKTFSPNGLIFLAAKERTFISLEIRNGYVIYQYNLGEGTKLWITSNVYNDGNWHKITASRDGAKGNLFVDSEIVPDTTPAIGGNLLEAIDTIAFGGYPELHNHSEVTETRFDGCISNITIMGEPVDLRNNIQAYDVIAGCPDKFSPMVSFSRDSPGYVAWDRHSISNNFNLVLRFKTREKDGLIFYIGNPADQDQENFISLSLKDGRLVLISMNIELTSKEMFNDSQWHVASVTHDMTTLRLVTDDFGIRAPDSIDKALHLLHATVFIGGLPQRLKLKSGRAASISPFSGCIADLTVLGQVKNFANTTDRRNEILDKCILDEGYRVQVPVSGLPATLPPRVVDIETPEITTENPNRRFESGRGDGGIDVAVGYGGATQPPEINVQTTVNVPQIFVPPTVKITKIPQRPIGTVPTTTKQPPVQGCALPVHPVPESKHVVGYRFGTKAVSRLEYPIARGKYKKTFDFRFEFRSKDANGLFVYIANRSHKHYAIAYLQDGHIIFTFKGEHDPITIKSENEYYADDNWHTVELYRDTNNARITIDDKEMKEVLQKTGLLDINVPFYIGGVSPNDNTLVQNIINIQPVFKGCIRSVSMNDKPLENPTEIGVIPCSDNVESGTFFDGDAQTFVKLKERFKVGEVFTIKFDMKPRVNSGLLVAAHGRHAYFVLELHNGDVRLTADNGKGPVTTVFYHNNTYHLCDGAWHSIQAVKSRNVVTLSVDNVFNEPKIGSAQSVSADTGSALFLGGHRYLARVRGITSRVPFIGCVKNIEINSEPVQLIPKMVQGNITIGFCPTN